MVPIVDAVAIEIRLADFGPIFAGIGTRVGELPAAFVDSVAISFGLSSLPGGIDAAQGAVDRVAEFVDADAFVVVTIQQQVEEILFPEAGGLAAGAADALVLEGGVGMVPVFGHISVDLVLADDDQVHAAFYH